MEKLIEQIEKEIENLRLKFDKEDLTSPENEKITEEIIRLQKEIIGLELIKSWQED